MANKNSGLPVAALSAVVILGSVAAVFLMNNFGEITFGQSWPVLGMAVGLCLVFATYLELGLVIAGIFLLILLANLEQIPAFGKSWPFALIWIAILVVAGAMRSRATRKKSGS